MCEVDAIVHGETDDDHTGNALRSAYARDEGKGEVQRRLPSSLETHYHSLTESSCVWSDWCFGGSCKV